MTPEDRSIILHALGFGKPRRWSCRNYYATSSDQSALPRLVAEGLMIAGRTINRPEYPLTYYHVTKAGAEAAGVKHKVRREDRMERRL